LQGRTGAPRGANEFTQAELNFALFWGLAVQAYESTLVSADSRFDRFAEGAEALTPMEQQGLRIFQGTGRCDTCHRGAEFTTASFTELERQGPVRTIGGRNGAVTDNGFFRIGVRPIMEDVGLGGEDAFGRLLAVAAALRPGSPLAAGGAFKTPGLRNVELTGPYFHNGGQGTLEQVVEFYTRGGDFPGDGNLGPGIGRRPLSPEDRQAVVAFLKALTDDRVRYERAPFDHPELCVPVGHEEIRPDVLLLDGSDTRFSLSAAERWALIPAVGREGNPVPLQTFEELLQGIGADGTRAHTLTDPCPVD
jgi:cytochrome c peroxidase